MYLFICTRDYVNRFLLTVFLLLGCLMPGQINAQFSCDGLTWEIVPPAPCKFRALLQVTKDCHNEATILVLNGQFSDVIANTADGWIVEEISETELLLTHQNGIFPNGNSWTIEFTWSDGPGMAGELKILYPDLCAMESCESLNPIILPACPPSAISGTVYRECEGKDKTDQCTIHDVVVQLWDDQGILLDQQVADADGAYAFEDLPHGIYIVRSIVTPGWTPKVPISGEYLVDLKPGQPEERNFGLCPQCTCDDWEILMTQEPGNEDTSYLNIYLIANNPWCLSEIELTVDSADIMGVEVLEGGWEPEIVSQKQMICPGPRIDVCPVFHRWRVTLNLSSLADSDSKNTSELRLYGKGNQSPEPLCSDSIETEHPSRYKALTCCPDGYVMGPNLVQNGDFSSPTPLASDYSILTSGSLISGNVRIMNDAQAYASNNNWILPGFSGPKDLYLACDGHTQPNQAAWKQQLFGLADSTNYYFCAILGNLVRSDKNFTDPTVYLEIVDDLTNLPVATSGLLTIPENPKQWVQHSLNWTTPSSPNASYTLRIVASQASGSGNDFAIDNVEFRTCAQPPQDTCCKDLQTFCDNLEAGIVFSADSCKITMDLSALPPCYTIEWVDWGQGPEFGPWTPSTFPYPMHTFSGNGSYPISYLAIAYNDSNFICLEKVMMDTLEIQCQPCICGKTGFSLEMSGQTYNLFCTKGAPTPQLDCPAGDIVISGFFGCVDPADKLCDETVVNYALTGPNGIIDQGTTTNFPTFFYSASQVSAPGQYTLTATTLCPGQTDSCECVATWIMPPCDTCYCGGFSDMFVRTPQGAMNMAVSCGGAPLIIPCPEPGKGFHLTGVFGCAGDTCPPDHQIDWTLVHQSSGTTHSGGFQDNDPFFGIYILPTYISQPGLYSLTLTGYCNGDTCVCELQFIIDCPDLCPCDIADILAFSANVNQGFAVALANKSCKACFAPLALSDCETVEWYVGSTSGTPIGTSTGSETFCYTFPFSGTYTISMVVTRLKPDGTLCEVFVYSKTITVSCLKSPICTTSVFPNPGFGEGAVGGNMTMGGAAPGWIGEGDHPTVLEGVPESEDAWSILLTGCYFDSDVLRSAEPVCLDKKGESLLTARLRTPGEPISGVSVKVGRKPPGGTLSIQIIEANLQAQRYRVSFQGFLPLEEDDWYDITVPLNISNWEIQDSCGDDPSGVLVHVDMSVDNLLSNDQGNGDVRDAIIIDHICMDGTIVSLQPVATKGDIRLYPNPAGREVTLQLPWETNGPAEVLITDVTGSAKQRISLQQGQRKHILPIDRLLPGMYFVQVIEKGVTIALSRLAVQP